MSEENDKTTGGFSRKVPHRDIFIPRVRKSGVKNPVKWKKEWDSPDYVEGPEEKRPPRDRRSKARKQHGKDEVRLGTMEVSKAGEVFTSVEKNLLKKLKEKNKK